VLRFAAQRAIALDRHAVEALTLDQIGGLGDAAREGQLPAFVQAAKALGLEVGQGAPEAELETGGSERHENQGRPTKPAARPESEGTPPSDSSRQDRAPNSTSAPGGDPAGGTQGRPGGSRRRVDFENT